jgi:hypothetical protein
MAMAEGSKICGLEQEAMPIDQAVSLSTETSSLFFIFE